MNFPKSAVFTALALLVGPLASAQVGTPRIGVPQPVDPAKAPLEVSGEADGTVWLKGTGLVSTQVYIRNKGAIPLTIIAVGANPIVFAPTARTRILPGERKPITILINMTAASFPLTGPLFFEAEDGTGIPPRTFPCTATFASKEVVMLDAKTVRWTIGEAPLAKEITITNVPNGFRVIGVKPLNATAAFSVALDGSRISVTPRSTAALAGEPMQIETEPTLPQPATFLVYVMPAPSAAKAQPAVKFN